MSDGNSIGRVADTIPFAPKADIQLTQDLPVISLASGGTLDIIDKGGVPADATLLGPKPDKRRRDVFGYFDADMTAPACAKALEAAAKG
jgi:hypothetical protein